MVYIYPLEPSILQVKNVLVAKKGLRVLFKNKAYQGRCVRGMGEVSGEERGLRNHEFLNSRKESLYMIGGDVNWCSRYEKQRGVSSKT